MKKRCKARIFWYTRMRGVQIETKRELAAARLFIWSLAPHYLHCLHCLPLRLVSLFAKSKRSFSKTTSLFFPARRFCDHQVACLWLTMMEGFSRGGGGFFNWLYCRRSGLNFTLFIPFFRLASNYRFRRLAACNEAINGQLPGWPSYYVQIDSGLRVWASSICLSVYLIPFTGPLVVRPFTSALSIARELTTKYDQLIPHNYKQKIQFNFGNHAIAVSVVQTILTQNCKYGFNSYLCL